jgi:hypothetical protein
MLKILLLTIVFLCMVCHLQSPLTNLQCVLLRYLSFILLHSPLSQVDQCSADCFHVPLATVPNRTHSTASRGDLPRSCKFHVSVGTSTRVPSIRCPVVSTPDVSQSGSHTPCSKNACMQRESDADSLLFSSFLSLQPVALFLLPRAHHASLAQSFRYIAC